MPFLKSKAQSKKVLFLDIDGVLNHHRSFSKGVHIDNECVILLDKVLKAVPELDIVVSSVWRHHGVEKIQFLLKSTGARHAVRRVGNCEFQNRVVDVTGRLNDIRGKEIQQWLDHHPEVERFVILDDDSDMLESQMPWLVQTDTDTGLMEHHIEKILELLNV